jgi:hypothetical protein
LKNVFEHLKLADVFQTEKLKSACAQMIWQHLRRELGMKKGPEWMELKKNFPELAIYVLEKYI